MLGQTSLLFFCLVFAIAAPHWERWLLGIIANAATTRYTKLRRHLEASAECTTNRFLPLESARNQIRLVTIRAGPESDPLECTVRTTTLGNEEYEGLSHLCGGQLVTR